jgi:hypothetical protein
MPRVVSVAMPYSVTPQIGIINIIELLRGDTQHGEGLLHCMFKESDPAKETIIEFCAFALIF